MPRKANKLVADKNLEPICAMRPKKAATTEIRRMAFLGRATGQRNSDILRMRAADLEPDGINVRIGKLRDQPHFVPLTAAQMGELRSWGCRDMELLVCQPSGARFTRGQFKSAWMRWRDEQGGIVAGLTLHGLRATAVADRRAAGTEDGAIADEIGMSQKMVSRYVRFADKAASARASRDRREGRR